MKGASQPVDVALVPAFGVSAAREAAAHWGYGGDAELDLLCVSENATYLVRDLRREPAVLRLNRPGYLAHDAIASELAWTAALRTANVACTPRWVPTLSGEPVARVKQPAGGASRHAVLFDFARGEHPDDPQDGLAEIGEIAARLHAHARSWPRPEGFTRFSWDLPAALGGDGRPSRWGDWRDAVTGNDRRLLETAESQVRQALSAYGQSPARYGLIHADLRAANLIVDAADQLGHGPRVTVIDFDDCGYSWFLYDAAGSVSFLEHRSELPELVAGWLDGYRRVATLEPADLAAIPALIMLRRLQLQAWAASHAETDMVRSLGTAFAAETVLVAERFLDGRLLAGAI
jgi:Ser/Thr protein kinase RdoA (MazF antagonist)